MKKQLSLALLCLLPLLTSPLFGQWRKLSAFSTTFFNEAYFVDANTGWLTEFNSTIVRTTDGGTSWQTSTLPSGTGSFNRDLSFISTTVGFVSGSDGIWKTSDGGATWTNITPTSFPLGGSTSHWFIDGNVGVYGSGVCTDSTVTFSRTLNGGTTWTTVTYVNSADVAVGGMTYRGGSFYASGGNGKVWQSNDSGASWTLTIDGSAGWQEDMVTAPGGGLFTASANGSSCGSTGGGKVMRSTDGGTSWSTSNFPTVVMWGVTMYSSSEGWACGDGGKAFKTTDGGSTWTDLSCGMNSLDRLDDIFFSDATHGWAVGDGIYKFSGIYYATRPDTIDFGDVLVKTTTSDSLARVKAVGPAGTVDARQLVGRDPGQFGVTGGLGSQTMGACQEAATALHFSPTSEGIKLARLDYIIPGQSDTPHVYIRGRGVAPHIASAGMLPFDTLLCGSIELDTLIVTNTGTYPLRITGASFENMTGGSFQLVSPTVPNDIPPGTSRAIVVQVNATGMGVVSGQIVLVNNDLDSAKQHWRVQLNAYRRRIAAQVTPDTLITIPSGPINTLVTGCAGYINSGEGLQQIESVTAVSGSGAIMNSPTVTNLNVSAAGQMPICFQVTASDTGWIQRRFRIRTQPCGIDTFVTVRYYARNPIIKAPATRILQNIRCDQPSYDTILVNNSGNAPLIIDRPYFTGTDGADFSITSPTTWPDTIPINGTLKIAVLQGSGSAAGPKSAILVVPNNDLYPNKNPLNIQITGEHDLDSLWLSRKVIDLGTLCKGVIRTVETVQILNGGTVPGTVLTVTPDVDASEVALTVDPTGHRLAAGVGDSLRLRITPSTVGPFLAHVAISFGDCGRHDTITIIGTVSGFDLAGVPVAFGGTRVGTPTSRTTTLTNKSASTATVIGLRLEPPDPRFTIVSPQPPFSLPPGTPVSVTIQFLPTDTLPAGTTLIAVVDGPCADSLVIAITGRGLQGDLLPTKSDVRFAPMLSCNSGALRDSVVIRNHGDKPLNITGISLTSGGSGPFSTSTSGGMPVTILPDDSTTIVVDAADTFFGDARDTLIVTTEDPNQRTIRIPVSARREQVELAALDSMGGAATGLIFEPLAGCIQTRRQILHLKNGGTIADTVTLSVGMASTSVTPRFVIVQPGMDTLVAVSVTISAPGILHDTLRIASIPCQLSLALPIEARFATVSATANALDIGSIPVSRSITDSTIVINTGDLDQNIEKVYIEGAANGFSVTGTYDGSNLMAGKGRKIGITFAPITDGAASATLVVITGAPCYDTIRTTLTGIGIRSTIFIPARTIDYGSRLGCADSCVTIQVEGLGPKSVTLLSAAFSGPNLAAFTLQAASLPATIQPNMTLPVTICFHPSELKGSERPTLVFTSSDSAQPTIVVYLDGALSPGLSGPGPLTIQGLRAKGSKDTSIMVHNAGSVPITIDNFSVPEPFQVISMAPITIAPGDSARIDLHAAPDSGGHFSGMLMLHQVAPCQDSLAIPIDATVQAEELSTLIVDAGHGFGRWGTSVTIPVTLHNPNALRMNEATISVRANPRLLEPEEIRASAAGTALRVERTGFDAATGLLTLRILPAEGDSIVRGSDIAIAIDYQILRGDTIMSSIDPNVVAPTGPTIRTLSQSGEFTLQDFCDAYGRLLSATGSIDLKPVAPNPATSNAVIELEVPFAGPVRLSLYDARGEEVLRPLDEISPAGRRRLIVDVRTLPSGIYFCRFSAGIQTLTERMVIAK